MTMVEHDTGLWIPDEARAEVVAPGTTPRAILDNRTDLPDQALFSYFEENTAAFGWNERPDFQSFSSNIGRSALARGRWTPPTSVIEEIRLARDLAERDDDIAPAIESLIATAFADGYQNQHEDEQVEHTFDKITEAMGLRRVLAELYREWLISYQINTVTIFTREQFDIRPEGVSRVLSRNVASPLVGVLPAENIRVMGDDLFGNAALAFIPEGELARWLEQYFSATAARQAAMRRENPVRAALFVEKVTVDAEEGEDFLGLGHDAYRLNPALVDRTTGPKGSWKYPRPILTRNLPLLEAKRLLNIMDHALLVGGTNYIIVAKKGSKEQPALQPEIDNLKEVVKRASRSGVLIGDHRIDIEIITPDLSELLAPGKRSLIARKLTLGMLRVPGFEGGGSTSGSGGSGGGSGSSVLPEFIERTVTHDRNTVRDFLHDKVWAKTMNRNRTTFGRVDRPTLWMPKIILTGQQFFNDYLLKMYDRGDLPRKWMIEYGGFPYDGAIAQKKREVAAGHDDIFQPPHVPFSSPQNGPGGAPGPGPNDNQPGPGRGNGQGDPQRPTRVIRRTPGETIRAYWSDEEDQVIRIGEITDHIIREYPESEIGRMTSAEISACEALEFAQVGPVVIVPVNIDVPMSDLRAVRLEEGLSIVVGHRTPDDALMTRAVVVREPHFTRRQAEDLAIRWGYEVDLEQPELAPAPTPSPPAPSPGLPDEQHAMEIHVHMPGQQGADGKAYRMVIERDEEGRATGSRYEPIEES